jgi:hypothetical protein
LSGQDPDFASGSTGEVVGIRLTSRALLLDALCDAAALGLLIGPRVRHGAASWPRRKVLVLSVQRVGERNVLDRSWAELERSRHEVTLARIDAASGGKFQNLGALLAEHPPAGHDWLLIVDDDVELPVGFLDNFIFLAERFGLRLAQPAHRHRSHAAWQVTRRRAGSLVRETRFVEIGPVTGFHSSTFERLLPFPDLRVGWGLDHHWSAVAKEQGWRIGVVDATAVRHGIRPVAASYRHAAAFAEARDFLAERPYTTATEAQQTIATHWVLR